MTEYKCGSAETCQFGEMCKPNYDIGGCSHYKKKKLQTNEEWFCGLSTEKKAKEILRLRLFGAVSEKGILRWLKQPHSEVEK